MDNINKAGQIDLKNAVEGDKFIDYNGRELTFAGRGGYKRKYSNDFGDCFILVDNIGHSYPYQNNGLLPVDMEFELSSHCNLKKKIDIVEEDGIKAERVEIRLKIALKLVDDVDNRNMRERLKKQIDKIEAAIMDFD